MQTIKCDRCRKIKKESKDFRKNDKWAHFISSGGSKLWRTFDLCDKCAPELVNFVEKYLKLDKK